MRKPFDELRNKMSAEARAEIKERANKILSGMEPFCPECAAKNWMHYKSESKCLQPSSTTSSR